MNANKMAKPNNSIKCAVNSCYYNSTGEYCCADKIEVKPVNAKSTQETGCATFTLQN